MVNRLLFWFASFCGILGALLNAMQLREGFLLWLVSNPLLFYQAVSDRSWNIALIFMVYFSITCYGLISWR